MIAQPPGQPLAPSLAPSRTSGLAIASLVLGILWFWWIGSLLAVIFGHSALNEIGRSQGRIGGRGLAIAGLVLGYIGLATIFIGLIFGFFATMMPHY